MAKKQKKKTNQKPKAQTQTQTQTKKNDTATKIVSYVLFLLVLLACLALLIQCVNGGKEDLRVEHDGERIVSDAEMKLSTETALRFDVKYASDRSRGYDVAIVSNATRDTDFDFTVDGVTYKYADESEYTPDFKSCFDFQKKDDYFTLILHDDMTMQSIFDQIYADHDVVIPSTVDLREKCYFAIVVTSFDGKTQIRIPFRIAALSIALDHSSIIF